MTNNIRTPFVPTRQMQVGMNYMWGFNKYGLYFGPHWRDGEKPRELWMDNWTTYLDRNLDILRTKWNIRIVRIFLLCNAQNWGNSDATGTWQPPATLDARFQTDLENMLRLFEQKDMKVIPSLLDFGIAAPALRSEERIRIVNDDRTRRIFLEQVVDPLLAISAAHRGAIYAWEVMNEPSWLNANIWPDGTVVRAAASVSEISTFLRAVLERIKNLKFESTVGHRYYDDLDEYPTGTIPQFHYYPRYVHDPILGELHVVPFTDPERLPTYGKPKNAFLGEFGASDNHGEPWNELDGADVGSARERVRERLKRAAAKGYSLAMVWPDGDWNGSLTDDPLKLSAEAQQGLTDFTSRKV